jgi:hypothetical protein
MSASAHAEADYQPVQKLLDLSGLAWLGADRFLAVHDAKNPDELGRVRVSLLKTPVSLEGIIWAPLRVKFPDAPSSDLESASRVPDSNFILLAESNDDAGEYRRVFLAQFDDESITVKGTLHWTSFTDAFNVEATAVASNDEGYLFIWAERNSGSQQTTIQWSNLTLDPFEISTPVGSVPFTLPADLVDRDGNPLYSRAIVGMDIDSSDRVLVVTAYDPEGSVEHPDNGPFRSAIMRIGKVIDGGVVLDNSTELLATVDGFKIESVSVAESEHGTWLFVGTDDENYGGTLRRLPH